MRTVTVADPSGVPWQVRVRWLPRHRALFRRFGGWRRRRRDEDRVTPGGAVFWWLLLPLLLVVLDVLLVLILLVVGMFARVLLRRPWCVDATSPRIEHEL